MLVICLHTLYASGNGGLGVKIQSVYVSNWLSYICMWQYAYVGSSRGGGGTIRSSMLRHNGHLSSRGSLAQVCHSLCLGSQLRLVAAGWSIHMGQSPWNCSLASTFLVFEAVLLSGCWGSGVARRGGGGAALVSIPVSPRWCGLRRLLYSCGWSWSRVGHRVPILCRVVNPARWSRVGAGT